MRFDSLKLDQKIKDAIAEIGYERCTPIQEQALPESLEGSDLVAQSQTGTGKTAVFLVTIIQKLLDSNDPGKKLRALIIVPTRELAVQVETQARQLCKFTQYRSISLYGGVGYEEQEKALNSGVEIAIATPGRLIDYIKSKKIDLSGLAFFVVDEADRMFDMGFMPDVNYILQKSPPKDKRQTMIFSATLDSRVRRLAERFMGESVEVEIEPDQITVDKVEQKLFHVSREEKLPLLLTLLAKEDMPKVVIFTNMKRTAERLADKLVGNGYTASAITGDVPQKKRLRIIEKIKSGDVPIMVATDVAARGIHIDGITHVINYDVPNAAANYVHRIGRTARAGAKGVAYTIACEHFVEHLPDIETYIEQKIEVSHIDFELVADKAPRHRSRSDEKRPPRGGKPSFGGKSRPSSKRRPIRDDRSRSSFSPSGNIPKKSMSIDERIDLYEKKYGDKFKKPSGGSK